MSRAARLALVDRDDPAMPVTAQCRLLKVARSTLYHQPCPVSDDDLAVMRALGEQYLETPFYGTRRMVVALCAIGRQSNPCSVNSREAFPSVQSLKRPW
jgi:putative transposase